MIYCFDTFDLRGCIGQQAYYWSYLTLITADQAVDEEDLLKQKYTIDDVILPLPG